MSNNDWQEHDIMRALEQFDPQPSARFHQRMQAQPWMEEPMSTSTHAAPKRTVVWRWVPVLSLLAVVSVAGTVFVTPPLRALAQEMLAWVVRTPSDTMMNQELAATAQQPSLENLRHGLSQAEAEQLAGFKLWKLRAIPEGHHFREAFYLPAEQTVASSYVVGDHPGVNPQALSGFALMQQPVAQAASGKNVFPIGSSAAIETVQIGDVMGQYVEGGWGGANSDPETPMQWYPAPGERTLRWQRGEWVFTLAAHDVGEAVAGGNPPSITREQMIDIAAHLVPPQK